MSPLSKLSLSTALPIRALNAGLFVSPGVGIHPDRVIDSHELILVRSGILHIAEGRRTFAVRSGQTLLLFAGKHHHGTQEYTADLSFYWVHFQSNRATKTEQILHVPQSASPRNPDRLKSLFHRFLGDQKAGDSDPLRNDLLVMLMLAEAGARHPKQDESDHAATVIAQAEAWIDTHFHRCISAQDVARAVGYNIDYLTRLVRKHRGESLTQRIQNRRLTRAASELRDTLLPLKQIAARCGFVDPGYMRRLFVRREGLTPGAYRRANSRVHINVR